MMQLVYRSTSPDDTRSLAARMAALLGPRAVLALHGDLGSGKTCFVQGLAVGLGIKMHVTSPTFTLIREYRGTRPLFHVDLYRIEEAEHAEGVGLEDYFEADGITAVEWADRAEGLFPEQAVHVYFKVGASPGERLISIRKWPRGIAPPFDIPARKTA